MKPEMRKLARLVSRIGRPFGAAEMIDVIPIREGLDGWTADLGVGKCRLVTDRRVRAPVFELTMRDGDELAAHWHRSQVDIFVTAGHITMIDGAEMTPHDHSSIAPGESYRVRAAEDSRLLLVFQPGIRLEVVNNEERGG